MSEANRAARRVLLHLPGGRRVPIEPGDVFLLEADGDERHFSGRHATEENDEEYREPDHDHRVRDR